MRKRLYVALLVLLTGVAGVLVGGRVLAPPVGEDPELDAEPKDPERAAFVIEGKVIARYTRNIRDRTSQDPELRLPEGSAEERRDAERLLSTNWIYGVYEVQVEKWEQLVINDTHPREPRTEGGVIAIFRGLVDAPRADGPYTAFSQDVETEEFELVQVGKDYRFVVEEDPFFRRQWYKLSAVAPLEE